MSLRRPWRTSRWVNADRRKEKRRPYSAQRTRHHHLWYEYSLTLFQYSLLLYEYSFLVYEHSFTLFEYLFPLYEYSLTLFKYSFPVYEYLFTLSEYLFPLHEYSSTLFKYLFPVFECYFLTIWIFVCIIWSWVVLSILKFLRNLLHLSILQNCYIVIFNTWLYCVTLITFCAAVFSMIIAFVAYVIISSKLIKIPFFLYLVYSCIVNWDYNQTFIKHLSVIQKHFRPKFIVNKIVTKNDFRCYRNRGSERMKGTK